MSESCCPTPGTELRFFLHRCVLNLSPTPFLPVVSRNKCKNIAFLLAPIREIEGLRSSRSYRDITEIDDGSAIPSSSVIRGVSFFGQPKRPLNNIPPGTLSGELIISPKGDYHPTACSTSRLSRFLRLSQCGTQRTVACRARAAATLSQCLRHVFGRQRRADG
jgi:hypothetical protein